MGMSKLDETCVFKISIKMRFFWFNYCYKNFLFLEFWLLLSRIPHYYKFVTTNFKKIGVSLIFACDFHSTYVLEMPVCNSGIYSCISDVLLLTLINQYLANFWGSINFPPAWCLLYIQFLKFHFYTSEFSKLQKVLEAFIEPSFT